MIVCFFNEVPWQRHLIFWGWRGRLVYEMLKSFYSQWGKILRYFLQVPGDYIWSAVGRFNGDPAPETTRPILGGTRLLCCKDCRFEQLHLLVCDFAAKSTFWETEVRFVQNYYFIRICKAPLFWLNLYFSP